MPSRVRVLDVNQVKIGTTFKSTFADGRADWKVVRARGRGTWDCEITSPDFEGRQKVFSTEEIAAERRMDRMWADLSSDHDRWWADRLVGETLHYSNGFGQYVRGIVVANNGKKELLPTAMVGAWKEHELPGRRADGEVRTSYQATKIAEKASWQPSHTCMFEAEPEKYATRGDPRTMEPIDLTVPPATPEQEVTIRLNAIRAQAREILTDWKIEPADALRQAQALLAGETF